MPDNSHISQLDLKLNISVIPGTNFNVKKNTKLKFQDHGTKGGAIKCVDEGFGVAKHEWIPAFKKDHLKGMTYIFWKPKV